jgi:subtilase family serine protease
MHISLVLAPPRRSELAQLAVDVTDPHSPRFRHFLSYAEWKSRYAPSDADMEAVANWAAKAGFREVHRFSTNGLLVVEGPVATVERAFLTNISEYAVGQTHFFANNRAPSLPPDIANRIDNILGLSSFEQVHPANSDPRPQSIAVPRAPTGPFMTVAHSKRDARYSADQGRHPKELIPAITGPKGGNLLEPTDLWSSQAYDFNALFPLSRCCNPTNLPTGSPRETSIAIVGTNKPQQSDYQTFFNTFGLAWNITEIGLDGPSCCDLEMTMDIEWAGAIGGGRGSSQQASHLFVYEGGSPKITELLNAYVQALQDNSARILSSSFGNFEDKYGPGTFGNPSISNFTDVTNAMTAIGWTIVVASGDQGGYADCNNLSVQYPASDPNAVAVGGTALALSISGGGLSFSSETTWSGNGCSGPGGNGGGSGGGCSNTFNAPWWSSAYGGCGGKRAVPDIAVNARTSQWVFYLGQWIGQGGTSIGAPEIAGFFAHENSYLIWIEQVGNICGYSHNVPCAPLGNPGPALYMATLAANHNPYYDIHDGGCSGGGPGAGFCSVPGYDKATGWGAPNMLQLAWAINSHMNSPGSTKPVITLNGPPINTWFGQDQKVNFSISGASMGIAGFTANWDADPGDPPTKPTPGSGDPFWDGPRVPLGTNGFLDLAAAGQGCHTAFVRGWDNLGASVLGTYGPVCFGQPPNCNIQFSCPAVLPVPPDYIVQCSEVVDFYNRWPDQSRTFAQTGTQFSGTASTYDLGVVACKPGTNNCIGFSTFKNQTDWCGKIPIPNPNPKKCCDSCIAAGGYCTKGGPDGCTCQ